MPAVLQSALMLRWKSAFASACQRRYGDVFTVQLAGFGPAVYLADPDDIKTVFTGDPRTYHAGEAYTMLSGMLGPSSVVLLDEDLHRDRRRLMMAPFRLEAVARQHQLIGEIAAANVARWPVGTEFPVAPKMAEITLEVILRTAIGATDPERLAALRTVMPRLLTPGAYDTVAIARPALQQRLPWRRLRRRIAEADELFHAEIADRRADPNLAERTDTLAMLVRAAGHEGRQMTDAELRDQLMTLLLGGHDTTATALSWAFERLTRHPEVLARAAEAADSGDDEYLDGVARETLRVRPVVFDVGRVLKAPVEIAGYRIPAGVTVVPAIGLVHANESLYDDAAAFRPERMLGSTLTPTSWLPFGGGTRRCIGANLALAEMRIVLREVLRSYELATTSARGERVRIGGVIFQQPHRGGRITVRAKRTGDVPAAHSRQAQRRD